jgi:hypothetical protein
MVTACAAAPRSRSTGGKRRDAGGVGYRVSRDPRDARGAPGSARRDARAARAPSAPGEGHRGRRAGHRAQGDPRRADRWRGDTRRGDRGDRGAAGARGVAAPRQQPGVRQRLGEAAGPHAHERAVHVGGARRPALGGRAALLRGALVGRSGHQHVRAAARRQAARRRRAARPARPVLRGQAAGARAVRAEPPALHARCIADPGGAGRFTRLRWRPVFVAAGPGSRGARPR